MGLSLGSGDMERFTVEKDGLFGFLHLPGRHVEAYSGKALIVLGGSEEAFAQTLAFLARW